MQTLDSQLRDHPFLYGLDAAYLPLLAGCAADVEFAAGSLLFREGEPAGRCFLLHAGRLAMEITAPGRGPLIVQTLAAGDVAGFSWLLEPHVWHFDGQALEPVRAIALDGVCLRAECERDPRLGFDLMQRFARLATRRLQATRLRLLDVYGNANASAG
jgi:CRP-like cAMP-binding protein